MSIVVSGGKPRQVSAKWPFPSRQANSDYYGSRTVDLLRGSLTATYEGIVKSQPWVFAAVTRLTFWTARIPLKLYDGELSDRRQRVYEGDLAKLLKRPLPAGRGRMMWVKLQHNWSYFTYGKALTVKFRRHAGAPPEELWPVPWKYVRQVIDEGGQLLGFNVVINGQRHGLTLADVIFDQYPHGIPPLEALARTLQTEDAAMTYQAETLRNGITPRAAFSTEKKLGTKDMERMREELEKLYAGPEQGGNFALFDNEVKYDKPIGVSADHLGLDGIRKASREEVAGVFEVSPPFLGILDRATFNNVEELREATYVDSLGPKLEYFQDSWQSQLIDVEMAWADKGYYLEYDMGAILKPNPEGQARQALMEMQSGTTTMNERRKYRNLKPIDDPAADTVFVPVNMVPVGEMPGASKQEAESTLADDLTTEAFKSGQRRRTEGDDDDES